MLVSKCAENKDLEEKYAATIESKIISENNSKFTTCQEKDFSKLWPLLLTYGLGCE